MGQARLLALALPEASEEDHHGMASYRVRGRIYATVPDDDHLRIMLGEPEVRAAVARDPAACQELRWGKRLAGVVVELARAGPELLDELLVEAWARKAPPALVADLVRARGRATGT